MNASWSDILLFFGATGDLACKYVFLSPQSTARGPRSAGPAAAACDGGNARDE
jgi:hypothetical protein